MSARTLLFGGTFDPVHSAHLILAESAADELGVDRVYFIPSGLPPHKQGGELSPAADRVRMVERAIADNPRFALSRIEVDREGESYSIDTIREVRSATAGGGRPYLLIGSDSLLDLHLWKDPEEILAEADLVVAARPGYEKEEASGHLRGRFRVLRSPRFTLSATLVREKVRSGESIRYMVPDSVRHYNEENKLYSRGGGKSDHGA